VHHAGCLPLRGTAISTIEHDKLAHALNEHSALLGLPQAVLYADELGVIVLSLDDRHLRSLL